MNDYTMGRNPRRMSPHELAGLLHTMGDNATDGARLHGWMSWQATGTDETAGFLVYGTIGIDDEVIQLHEWQMPRDPFRWYAIGAFNNGSASEPPGVHVAAARVVRTTNGEQRLRFHLLANGNWCHLPQHHLNPTPSSECAGVPWPVLINMYGSLEEDL